MKQLVIIGAGDHGRVALDIARALTLEVAGFVEPPTGRRSAGDFVDGVQVLGNLASPASWNAPGGYAFVVALGNNEQRKVAFESARSMGFEAVSLIHPSASVLGGARILPGAQVCAHVVIGVGARVGENVIINTAATIDHDSVIEAHSFIAPGAHLAGRVRVGVSAFVGIGAVVREGCTIGPRSVVAAGAAVVSDVPGDAIVKGVPAR